jgi:4a-hydroxytetrahydrobiopterin dehydratase
MSELEKRRCVPCEGGVPKLEEPRIRELHAQIRGWDIQKERLRKIFEFRDFTKAMAFVNEMARIADEEQHHPDFCVHWNRVIVFLWTHALNGLSENDFILAAKLDRVNV